MHTYSRGELYFANLSPVIGSEQAGYRPVLIVQNNTGNWHSPTVIIASVTSRGKNDIRLPTHCFIRAGDALKVSSIVQLEQLRTIDKRRLCSYIGRLNDTYMKEINRALAISIGLEVNITQSISNKTKSDGTPIGGRNGGQCDV